MHLKKIALCCISLVFFSASLFAQAVPVPITAEQAFDSYASQTDPVSGAPLRVALVDVRSFSEYYWIGAAAKVDVINTESGTQIIPDNGKTVLTAGGLMLKYTVNGRCKFITPKQITSIVTSPISLNIPYKNWNEATKALELNPNFTAQIEILSESYDVLILFCKTGGRSGECTTKFNTGLFDAVYEIDQPDGTSGMGGFEGTNYSDIFNGYTGYPSRPTFLAPVLSVSWKDAGLPIHIGWKVSK